MSPARPPAGQTWNPQTYAENARFVADLGRGVVDWLAPQSGESILDLGCGDGALTETLAAVGCEVFGIDASPEQIAAAKLRGLHVAIADGHSFDLGRTFDAVFSNAALHWMREPARVLRCVHRGLKPGGRFVGELGGAGNTATVVAALRAALSRRGLSFDELSPWYFPSAEEYQGELTAAGFDVQRIELFPRPTLLPGDLLGWLDTFAGALTSQLPRAERTGFLQDVRSQCLPALCDADGRWTVDYVRLRFAAVRRP